MATTVKNSVLASIMISIGCMAFIACDNKVVGAVAFSVGLLTICYFNMGLYTGVAGTTFNSIVSHNKSNLICVLITWITNWITMIFLSGIYVSVANTTQLEKLHEMQIAKYNQPFWQSLLLAVGCGVLMYIAVTIRKPLYIIMCVAGFILCGFEHSVADMFYMSRGTWKVDSTMYFTYILTISLGNLIGTNVIPILRHNKGVVNE